MGHAWWGLAMAAAGVIGVGYLGWALTRAIWTGRAPQRVPISASILVALAAAQILDGQRPSPAPTLVAAANVAEPSCITARGLATPELQSGERVTVAGSDQVRAGCSLWAIITDPRTGERWAQGPAMVAADGWTLTLVLGTGQSTVRLPYQVEVSAFETDIHTHLQEVASPTAPLPPGALPKARDALRSLSVELPVVAREG